MLLRTHAPLYYKIYIVIQMMITIIQILVYFKVIHAIPNSITVFNKYLLLVIGILLIVIYNPFYNIRYKLDKTVYRPFLYALHFYAGNMIVLQYLSL